MLEKGDLYSADLDALVARAPKDATLVICHSAVLSYTLDQADRDAFSRRRGGLTNYWLSNESPILFSDFGVDLVDEYPDSHFLTALNGKLTSWSNPHGSSLRWIDHNLQISVYYVAKKIGKMNIDQISQTRL